MRGPLPVVPVGHRRGVAALTFAVFAVYAALSVARHYALQTTAYDLGIFADAVRHWAHFQLPQVAVKGVHDNLGANFDLLGDHFHPILVLLAPTWWIWPHPVTLLVDQALLMAVSVVPVWSIAQRRLGSAPAAYLAGVAYALYWGLQTAVVFDFHEIAFAVPLIAVALERIDAGRFVPATAAIALLVTVKEDLPVLVVFFGLYVMLKGRRRLGAGLAVYGAVTFVVITRVAIPYFAGGHPYAYWQYDALGPNLPSALGHLLGHPLDSARLFVTPATKWHTLLLLFAPFGLLTAASPALLLTVPLLAERFFAAQPKYWVAGYHYSATIAPVIAIGGVDGLARLLRLLRSPRSRPRTARLVATGFAVAAVALTAAFPFRELASPRLWLHDPHIDAGWAAIRLVPPHVTVEAADEIQPHLTGRDRALLADGRPHGAAYVVLDTSGLSWPFPSIQAEQDYADRLRAAGWTVLFDRAGYVVLRAPRP